MGDGDGHWCQHVHACPRPPRPHPTLKTPCMAVAQLQRPCQCNLSDPGDTALPPEPSPVPQPSSKATWLPEQPFQRAKPSLFPPGSCTRGRSNTWLCQGNRGGGSILGLRGDQVLAPRCPPAPLLQGREHSAPRRASRANRRAQPSALQGHAATHAPLLTTRAHDSAGRAAPRSGPSTKRGEGDLKQMGGDAWGG